MDNRKRTNELQLTQIFHRALSHTEKCMERLIWNTFIFNLSYWLGLPRTETGLQNKLKCFSLTFLISLTFFILKYFVQNFFFLETKIVSGNSKPLLSLSS